MTRTQLAIILLGAVFWSSAISSAITRKLVTDENVEQCLSAVTRSYENLMQVIEAQHARHIKEATK